MKKLLYLFIAALAVSACSVDSPELSNSADLAFSTEQFENSNLGNYKGVFSTSGSEYRATLDINIPALRLDASNNDNLPTANITFHDGESFIIFAERSVDASVNVTNLRFSGNDLSFNFSVNNDGSNPVVSDVVYKNLDSDILVAKNTSRGPVTAFTGTYQCFSCGNTAPKTWNVMISNDGQDNETYTTQVDFNSSMYSGIGLQENCAVDATNADVTFCSSLSGNGTNPNGFSVGTNGVQWEGSMAYSNSTPDCSNMVGLWFYLRGEAGEKSGTFKTDPTPIVDNCFTRIVFENFEDATLSYTTSIPEFTDLGFDYFTRTDGTNIGSTVNFTDIVGNGWFGAQDINGDGAASLQYIYFNGLNVAPYATIYFNATFAEDVAADGNNDWDATSYLHVEYSYDSGVTWTKFFAIEADIPTGANGLTRIDTDLDGIGDGALITDTFTGYQAAFANTGSTVDIRIAIDLNDGDEDIAIDNILIRGY